MRELLLDCIDENSPVSLLMKNGRQVYCQLKQVMHHLLIVDSLKDAPSILIISQIKEAKRIATLEAQR